MDITVSEGPTCGDLVRVTRLRGLVRVSWVSRYDGAYVTWAWGDLDREQAIALTREESKHTVAILDSAISDNNSTFFNDNVDKIIRKKFYFLSIELPAQ